MREILTTLLVGVAVISHAAHMPAAVSPEKGADGDIIAQYEDSLRLLKARIDSMERASLPSVETARLFLPPTFYGDIAGRALRGEQYSADNYLMDMYLNHPWRVTGSDKGFADELDYRSSPDIILGEESDIVDNVAPAAEDPDVIPVAVAVKKPNFWTYKGDYYLQLLQNYISGNWYKGGESNYSMVGSITMEANYNNKQKVEWDNKLELKLGFQSSRSDSVHRFKTSEDLIRYTTKLGLQATTKWYYTLQMIAYTQFTRGYKSNDEFVYSDFMAPFNLNVSLGMDYKVEWMKKRLTGTVHLAPLAANYRYVRRLELATSYGLDEGKHSMLDWGSQLTVDLVWKFSDNAKWTTRLYGYTTYHRAELEWENTFTFQFNKWISTNIFLYPRFDDNVTRDDHHGYFQFKEYASVGFAYSF